LELPVAVHLPCDAHHDDVVLGELVAARVDISREEVLRARRQLLACLGVGLGLGLASGLGSGSRLGLGLGLC
jgi:hypothetical protein